MTHRPPTSLALMSSEGVVPPGRDHRAEGVSKHLSFLPRVFPPCKGDLTPTPLVGSSVCQRDLGPLGGITEEMRGYLGDNIESSERNIHLQTEKPHLFFYHYGTRGRKATFLFMCHRVESSFRISPSQTPFVTSLTPASLST